MLDGATDAVAGAGDRMLWVALAAGAARDAQIGANFGATGEATDELGLDRVHAAAFAGSSPLAQSLDFFEEMEGDVAEAVDLNIFEARDFASVCPGFRWAVPWGGFGKGGGLPGAAGRSGRYAAMKLRTLASVSGQTRRGLLPAEPRSPLTNFQSLTASRPKVLSAMPWASRKAATSARRVS
jgi:hypothetical protein